MTGTVMGINGPKNSGSDIWTISYFLMLWRGWALVWQLWIPGGYHISKSAQLPSNQGLKILQWVDKYTWFLFIVSLDLFYYYSKICPLEETMEEGRKRTQFQWRGGRNSAVSIYEGEWRKRKDIVSRRGSSHKGSEWRATGRILRTKGMRKNYEKKRGNN